MSDRLARFAPLITGVLFVVMVLKGTQMTSNTPATTANGATVLAYYQAHNARMGGAGFSLMLSVVFGLLFYGMLRSYLSRSPRAEWAAMVGFGGAIMFGVGALVRAGVDFAFSDVQTQLSAATAQVLNVLQSDLNAFLISGGLCALMVGFGIAILRGRLMPGWLGLDHDRDRCARSRRTAHRHRTSPRSPLDRRDERHPVPTQRCRLAEDCRRVGHHHSRQRVTRPRFASENTTRLGVFDADVGAA